MSTQRCFRCNEILPQWFALDDRQNGWNMVNVAPDAASGGSMMPIHWRCQPQPFDWRARAEALEKELADMTTDRDHWKANHDEQVKSKRRLSDRYAEALARLRPSDGPA